MAKAKMIIGSGGKIKILFSRAALNLSASRDRLAGS
jgi:hypothetical protein